MNISRTKRIDRSARAIALLNVDIFFHYCDGNGLFWSWYWSWRLSASPNEWKYILHNYWNSLYYDYMLILSRFSVIFVVVVFEWFQRVIIIYEYICIINWLGINIWILNILKSSKPIKETVKTEERNEQTEIIETNCTNIWILVIFGHSVNYHYN